MKDEFQQPFRIHQYHYSVSSSDGISYQMFFIQSALAHAGISGSVFATRLNDISSPKAFKLDFEKCGIVILLLIHHSLGNPSLKQLNHLEIPKALIYHNITPAQFFPHDPTLSALSELGRKQLQILKKDTIAAFTGSKFNFEELKKHLFHQPQLLPLLDIPEDLKEVKKKKQNSKKGAPKNLLFVGCLTPHKNQNQLIKTFYYLKKLLPKHSKLYLVGSQDPVFLSYLNLLIKQLNLNLEIKLTGRVNRKILEQHYEMADAFVCLSKHEGFCIPLVEAMSRQVPVFYLTTPGVKETMGNSGVALHTEDPFEVAQIIYTVLENPKALSAILRSQHRRLIELGREHNVDRVQKVLLKLVKQVRSTPYFQINRRESEQFITA